MDWPIREKRTNLVQTLAGTILLQDIFHITPKPPPLRNNHFLQQELKG